MSHFWRNSTEVTLARVEKDLRLLPIMMFICSAGREKREKNLSKLRRITSFKKRAPTPKISQHNVRRK
jgi:hypothetical protein